MATRVSITKRNVITEEVDGQLVFIDDHSLSNPQSFPSILDGLTGGKLKAGLKKQTPSKWEAQTPYITGSSGLAASCLIWSQTPQWNGGQMGSADQLVGTFRTALTAADDRIFQALPSARAL